MDGGGSDRGYGELFTDEEEEQQQQQQQGGEEMEAKGRNMPSGNTHTHTHTRTGKCACVHTHTNNQMHMWILMCMNMTPMYMHIQGIRHTNQPGSVQSCRKPPSHTHTHKYRCVQMSGFKRRVASINLCWHLCNQAKCLFILGSGMTEGIADI